MPKHANIIHVGEQRSVLCLWAEVDTEEKEVDRRTFYMMRTGNLWPSVPVKHIGTVIKKEGRFVWHIYEAATRWMAETEKLKRLEERR